MGWVRTAAVCFLFAIALARGFRAASVDSGVRAEARRVALSPGAPQDDPEVAAFRLSFDLHVANGSERPIRLPASGSGKANSVRAAVLKASTNGAKQRCRPCGAATGISSIRRSRWIVIQYPAYCVGTGNNAAAMAGAVAGCQNTGNTIAGFMQKIGQQATVGGDPNYLAFPCKDEEDE